MKIVGMSGSLRAGSYNTGLVRAARELAPQDVEIELADIADIPVFNADAQQQGFPVAVERLVDQLRGADAVLIATPEYNYSIPGGLKNAIDWVSRTDDQPFAGKAVAIMGASMGNLGTARSQYHLRQVMVFLDARVMSRPEVFVGAAHQKFDDAGNLTDEGTREFLSRFLEAVRGWTEAVRRMSG